MSIVCEISADLVSSGDLDSTCRICLQSDPAMSKRNLFECSVSGRRLVEVLAIVGGIRVRPGDNYPNSCCSVCLQQIEAAYKLREQCRESNRRMKLLYDEPVSIKAELPEFEEEEEGEDSTMDSPVAVPRMTTRSFCKPPEVEEATIGSILHKYGLDGFTTIVEDQDLESVELFACLLEQDLQKMLPNETVGTIVRFRKAVDHAKQLNSQSSSSEKKRPPVEPEQPLKKRRKIQGSLLPNQENLSIKQLLKTVEGQCIITHYKKNGDRLDKHHQGKLLRLIIENLASTVDIKDIQRNWFGVIFSAIAEEFPSEAGLLEVYKAKFPNVKHNVLKKINTYSKLKQSAPLNQSFNDVDLVDENDAISSKEWLLNGREPWDQVQEHWKTSYQLRSRLYAIAGNEKLDELFTEWPILKVPNGIVLIRQDFERVYSPSSDIYQMWHSMKEKVCAFAHLNLKNKTLLGVLETFEEGLWTDDHLYIQILSALLSPGITARKYKPKFEETMNAIVREVSSENEIEEAIERYRARLSGHSLPVLPHVIFINGGDFGEKRYLIYVDSGRYYSAEGLLDAMDGVMKLCMTLNISYTPDAKPIWLFIQRYCYGLMTENDTPFACLRSLHAFLWQSID